MAEGDSGLSDARESFLRSDFSRREWRILSVLRDHPDGCIGVTALMKESGLPADEVRRILNNLERDGIVSRTIEQRPVKVWRVAADIPQLNCPSTEASGD